MAIQDVTTTQLLTDISQLLDDMILELELRGCEANHELVKRALAIKEKINSVKEA